MKNYTCKLLILISLSIPFLGQSQDSYCGTDEARKKLIEKHPEILKYEEGLAKRTKQFIANYRNSDVSRSGPIIIPIVFHILHQGGVENISDAQVLDEVRILNRDYNKENSDTSQVVASFKNNIANMGIEFRLANVDPNGNCTNGIERINSAQANVGDDYSKLQGWPRNKYVNVWVVKSMSGGAAGYAYYPSSVATIYSTPFMDGVNILHNYIGSIGTGSDGFSRALTHEIAHCFNLKHTWGDSNTPGIACGDDEVDDTPLTKGSNLTCFLNTSFCDTPIIENVQNYMEYSYCSKMFTEGQKVRVLAALHDSVADRNNLWTDDNVAFTATNYAVLDTTPNKPTFDYNYYPPSPCAPKADFYVDKDKRYLCQGDSVLFKSVITNGRATNILWNFPEGTPNFSTDSNVWVTFNDNVGWQQASLTVSNDYGSDVKSRNNLVYVAYPNPLNLAPAYERFEDPDVFNRADGWVSANLDNDSTYFRWVNTTSHSGSGCIMLNNYFATGNRNIDEVVSPSYDLSSISTAPINHLSLSFYYSLTSWNGNPGSMNDSLVVFYSTNCGPWKVLYNKGAGTLVLGTNINYFWTPPMGDEASWKKVTAPLPTNLNSGVRGNMRFKFQMFSSVQGNNFYLDDVNIGDFATGISDLSASNINDIRLFPNPSTGQSSLELNLSRESKVQVTVYDITGKAVQNAFRGFMNEGDNQVALNTDGTLSQGVYIVEVKAGDSVLQKKFVVQ